MFARQRLPQLIGAAAGAIVLMAAAVAVWLHHSPAPAAAANGVLPVHHPAGDGTTIAQAGATTLDRQATADALCRIQPAALQALTRLSPANPVVENLRDGLPALQQRLGQVRDAATGRPALTPVISDLAWVDRAWTAAITAQDRNHHAKAVTAIAAANKRLALMGTHLDVAYPGRAKDCAS